MVRAIPLGWPGLIGIRRSIIPGGIPTDVLPVCLA